MKVTFLLALRLRAGTLLSLAALACGHSSEGGRRADPRPGRGGATDRICAPVTTDRRWSEPRQEPRPDGSAVLHYNQAPPLPTGFDPASLAGEYTFVAVATAGTLASDTLATGSLWVTTSDSVARRVWCASRPFGCSPRIVHPLWGAFDPAFHFPGLEAVDYPASSRSPDQPGIVFSYDTAARRLEAAVGNDPRVTDSGMYLEVFEADAGGFTGRWVSGELAVYGGPGTDGARSQGHFCAWHRPGRHGAAAP